MIKALLFDLDDTLLGNDLGTFLPAYFNLLTRHFPEVEPARLVTGLVDGTRAMRASQDPALTMRQVFVRNFPLANGQEALLWERLESFYRTDFATLHTLTAARPAARAVLDWAKRAGYQVVVATSPLFPLSAIRERLSWAGLDDFAFDHITHIDNSHFAKPHPEYFAEILARLGLQPDEALMVGNDWSDDLLPCAALGLPHFWIAPAGTPLPSSAARPLGVGSLNDFLVWAEAHLAALQPPPPPAPVIAWQLAGDLAYLMGRLVGLSAETWRARPEPAEWSLTEIVGHLRDVDREVHLPRVQAVLTAENPFIAGADTDPWAVQRNYQAQSGPQALQEFSEARRALYTLLATQPPEAWSRAARHALFGPTTLREIAGWIVDHDRIHLNQVHKTLRALVPE